MKKQAATKRFALLFTTALVISPALSQTAMGQVPTSAQPGILERGLGEKERAKSRLEDTVVTPKEEASGAGLSKEKVFTLKTVVLDGTSAYKDADISAVYADMVGQKVSFADLNAIAQRMTRKYREDGYIFSRAVLPPQKVADGVVHLRAVEGRITNVKVVGNYHDNNGLIANFADRIRTSNVANSKEIERYLLLIDDLPGITAKSFIKPSSTPGGGDLIINVEEDFFEGSASIDRRGSEYIGPYKGTLVGAFNDVFRQHDRTTLRLIGTSDINELHFGELTHEEQVGCEGGKVKTRFAMTNSNPGGGIANQEIDGDSRLLDIEGTYPLVRSRSFNVNLVAGFNALNSETVVLGVQTAEDQVRGLRAGGNVDFTDSLRGVNQIALTVTQGIDALGATEDGVGRSRANGEHTFFKATVDATRIQELWDLWSMSLSASGQFSRDPLLASEEFSVGGASFGRAYDSGEIAGDKGWSAAAELRYGGPVDNEIVRSYQVYTFLDYGHITNKDAAVGEAAKDSVTSTGLGLRFNLQQDWSGYVELDKPLTKEVASEGDRDPRLFFNVLKRF